MCNSDTNAQEYHKVLGVAVPCCIEHTQGGYRLILIIKHTTMHGRLNIKKWVQAYKNVDECQLALHQQSMSIHTGTSAAVSERCVDEDGHWTMKE